MDEYINHITKYFLSLISIEFTGKYKGLKIVLVNFFFSPHSEHIKKCQVLTFAEPIVAIIFYTVKKRGT